MYNLERDTVLKTNTLDKAIRRCLSQKGDNKLLHLLVYYLRKLTGAELNYNVHNKELLAIINIIEH
jgi:pyruvate-formate lyase